MKTLASLLLLLPAAWAGAAGDTSLRALLSPRAVGMGEAGAGLANDALSAASLNPAGLAALKFAEGAVAHNVLYQGLSLQRAALAVPTRRFGAFGVSGSLFQTSTIQGYDNTGARASDILVRDFSLSSHYARRILGAEEEPFTGLFAGAGFSYARSTLDTVSADSLLADAGVLAAAPLGPGVASLGGSAMALGQGPRYDLQREKPPTVYRGGLSYAFPILGDPFTLAFDARRPIDEKFTYHAGFEYGVKSILFWRMGYASHQNLGSGFRFGVGFKLKVFTVDYALAEYGTFGLSHLIGLSMKFGEPLDVTPTATAAERSAADHVRRGAALLDEGRGYEAAREFNQALILDPHNRQALRYLKQIRDNRTDGGRPRWNAEGGKP